MATEAVPGPSSETQAPPSLADEDLPPKSSVHVSQSDPALCGDMLMPTHQNISIWGRVGNLVPAQEDALKQLKRIHPELSDREALRYLRARVFNVDQAAALCVESREWRQTEKPWTTDPATVRPLFDKGTLTFTPKLDCKNRPVMVIDPTHTTSGDSERVVRCFQWTLEATIAQLHKDVDDTVFIFDLRNFGMTHSDTKTPIGMIKSLQTGYPERMAMCIIYQPPRLFNLVWKVLRYIINARVHAKIHFVYTVEEIDKLIGPGVRPASLGGSESFDVDGWFKSVEGFEPSK